MKIKIKKLLSMLKKHRRKILLADAVLYMAVIITLFAFSDPDPVRGLKVAKSDYSTASISWKQCEAASGYLVYRAKKGEDYKYVGTTSDNSYTDTKLRTGTPYNYVVVARNGLKTSDLNRKKAVEVTPALEDPKLKIDTSKGKMELVISDVKGASAYEIIRDGKTIGTSKKTVYIDEKAEPDTPHKYEVKALRYVDDPVYSEASNTAQALLHQIPNFEITADESTLSIDWDSNDYYDNYKVYSGDELLGETEDTSYSIDDYKLDTTYDIKVVGFNSVEKYQSPEIEKRFKVSEEPMDNEAARQAACDWAVMIANDNSFTYGEGDRAHHCGCYFCGTNTAAKGSGYEKTYCCNPFVHACYAHGANDPQMLRTCQNGDSVGMNESDYTKYGNWERHSKPAVSDLQMGDVLVGSHHVMIYLGDGQIAHAAGEGWGADTIRVDNASSYYSFCDFVMRYTGTGSGTMYKVREVDSRGKLIEEKEEESEEEQEDA